MAKSDLSDNPSTLRPPPNRKRVLLAMDPRLSQERHRGIARYAREAGWILESRLAAFQAQGRQHEYLASARFDGVMALLSKGNQWLRDLVDTIEAPVVDLWHDYVEKDYPRVLLDHRAIGALGAEHLMGCGLKDLVFYSHTLDRRVAVLRRDGFCEAAEKAGARVVEISWDPSVSLPHGMTRIQWLGESLKDLPKPLGVLAVNDAVAAEVLDAAEVYGLRVPSEIAVLGIDNDPVITELGTMPLSSVDGARDRVGYEAAALLDKLMDGAPKPTSPILVPPAKVVTRQSTEVLAIPAGDVADAVRFIREHFRESITVDDVVARTYLSRRRLQDRFCDAIGHGMSEEITRQRLNYAKTLLAQTPRKIEEIARLAGFGSGERMSKVFRRKLNMTPNSFRDLYRAPSAP